jgi:inosose dehydratase
MRIGAAPISWGVCEIPGWGAVPPYARVLTELAECGYEGTELGPWGYLPTDPPTLRRELAARGLALAGAFHPVTLHDPSLRDGALRGALDAIALLADLGAPVLVLAEAGDAARARLAGRVPADGSASLGDDGWARLCDGASEIARRARERGLLTAFHPHAGSYVETPAEVERLLAGADPDLVGLCLDTGHIAYGGGDPLAVARAHADRVRHVHLKDLRRAVHASAVARGMDFPGAVGEGVFAPLGEGSLDLRATLRALADTGYAGWLIVEQDVRLGITPGASPKADAARGRAFVRQVLAERSPARA